jgi:uncharacterized protein YndB with AHSA1/START domain
MSERKKDDDRDRAEREEERREEREGEVRRFERRLPHPPEKVWRALTEPAELAAWFPAPEAGEAERAIVEAVPPKRLICTLGDETLTWELSPIPGGCLLVLTTEVAPANDAGIGTTRFRCAA